MAEAGLASGASIQARLRRVFADEHRAFWLIVANGVLARLFFEVFSVKRVIAAFLTELTHREWMVGVALAVGPLTSCVPVLLFSHAMEHRSARKPFYRLGAQIKWIAQFILLASVLLLPRHPVLLAWMLITMVAIYGLGDAVSLPAFGDIVARSVPAWRRGRLFGLRVAIGGTLAFLAGDLIRRMLGAGSPVAFPYNYFVLFLTAFFILLGAQYCFLRVEEPPLERPAPARMPLRAYLRHAGATLRGDRNAWRYALYRNLSPIGWLPAAFIVPYALDRLHFNAGVVGVLTSTAVIASSASNLGWGSLGDRRGNRAVLALSSLLLLVAAVLLALTPLVALHGSQRDLLVWLVVVNAVGEVGLVGMGNGQLNYLYDLAPDDQVPLYVGAVTTAAAPMAVLAPLLIGAAVHRFDYDVVFVLGVVFSAAVLLASLALGEPRLPERHAAARRGPRGDR